MPLTIWSARRWIAKNACTSASRPPASIAASEPDDPAPALVGAVDAEEGAHQHHPLEADVHDAAALGEHAADAGEDERRREDEHRRDQVGAEDDVQVLGAGLDREDAEADPGEARRRRRPSRAAARRASPPRSRRRPRACRRTPTRRSSAPRSAGSSGSTRARRAARRRCRTSGARAAAPSACRPAARAHAAVTCCLGVGRRSACRRRLRAFQTERMSTSAPTKSTISPWMM